VNGRSRLGLTLGAVALAALAFEQMPGSAAQRAANTGGSARDLADHQAVIRTYCVGCHNDRLRTADLALDAAGLANVAAAPEVWEQVLQKLRMRAMPPPGSRRPDDRTYDAFTGWLEASLDRAAAALPNPGRPVLARLNRTEYQRAIHDLLGLDVDVAALLPADDTAFGFDNIGDTLAVSPVLLESYLRAARKISRLAVGVTPPPVTTDTYRVAADLAQDGHFDGLPPGTRGGLVARHFFPVDGEYEIRVRLVRTTLNQVRGVDEQQQVDLALDGSRLALFSVGGEGFSKVIAGDQSGGQGLSRAFGADEHLHLRLPVKAGTRTLTAAFVARPSVYPEGAARPLAGVDRIIVTGPYPADQPLSDSSTPRPRERIFVCRPGSPAEEEPCAGQILNRLARLAYRRPPTAADTQDLMRFFREGRRQADGEARFDTGIEFALRRMLASPQFVLRVEDEPAGVAPGSAFGLGDVSLASRLSFFLWSSPPDDSLLTMAERGGLRERDARARQVDRMLGDPRSEALLANFFGQWLLTRNVRSLRPNPAEFPEFDDNLRRAFERETGLFIESIVRERKSVVELLTADYTFVNERLARHYGLKGVYGDRFRRVTLPADSPRRGLLGHGSILSVTSYATRTSPVLRGKWILENLFGAPPPPPPPNVPELQDADEGEALSMRERMVRHRSNPSCASCHVKMDPLGLALENFDAVGRWRPSEDDGAAFDTSGTLPDGTPFSGPDGLRQALVGRPEMFVGTMASKLLTYALGRGLTADDAPAVRAIVRSAAAEGYSFASLVHGVVESVPFRMKRAAGAPGTAKGTAAREP
jgi:mono/diheme cytochrome c family protein